MQLVQYFISFFKFVFFFVVDPPHFFLSNKSSSSNNKKQQNKLKMINHNNNNCSAAHQLHQSTNGGTPTTTPTTTPTKSYYNMTFLIQRKPSASSSDRRSVIGLLHGCYRLLAKFPNFSIQSQSDDRPSSSRIDATEKLLSSSSLLPPFHRQPQTIRLAHINYASDEDELAEFGLLNYKDRAIIRANDENGGGGRGAVVFGARNVRGATLETPGAIEYFSLDGSGTLVVRGPITIRHLMCPREEEEVEEEEEEEDKDEFKYQKQQQQQQPESAAQIGDSGDDDDDDDDNLPSSRPHPQADASPPDDINDINDRRTFQEVKFFGHVTLNIAGNAAIELAREAENDDNGPTRCGGTTIVLSGDSKFWVESAIPFRFQQKTIVQRQKEKFQNSQGMMSLETFDHLLA